VSGRYLFFVATVVGLIAVPGPDMLYVIGRATAHGRRAGWFSALGIAAGYSLMTLLVAAGFQVVFEAWPALFSAIKLIGIVYLTFLAARLMLSDGALQDAAAPSTASDWRAFSAGVATAALNPKGLLFYFSILPQFFVAGPWPFWQHALVYGLTTSLLCLVLYSAIGTAVSLGARRFLARPEGRRRLSQIAGLMLLAAVVLLFGTDWIAPE
jgi:threonine/homoserine/homoserine lactone efflux protein